MIGYNYYSIKQSMQILEKCSIMQNVLQVICNYCGVTNWDNGNKGSNIDNTGL